jgi:glycosyltransferase involved in cell wall biosynthesis
VTALHWAEAFVGARRAAYFGLARVPRSWSAAIDAGTAAIVIDIGDDVALLRALDGARAGIRVAISSTIAPRALIDAIGDRVTVTDARVDGVDVRLFGETGGGRSELPLLELTEAQLGGVRRARDDDRARWLARIARSAERQRDRIAALSREVEALKQRLGSIERSKRFRLAHALALAARSPREALRLPRRISRLYGESRVRPAKTAAPGADPKHALDEALDRFLATLAARRPQEVVVMVSGTTFIQPIRANRPIRLARLLLDRSVPTLFSYHGALDDPPAAERFHHDLLFEAPIDFFAKAFAKIARADLGETDRILIVAYPHLAIARQLGVFAAEGWATLYDCRDDWEAFAEVGAAEWYDRSIERYVVNGADATFCVSRPLAEKIRGWTDRPVDVSPNAYDPAFRSPGYARRAIDVVKVGYFGHLSERWFDWDALAEIARRRPSFTFEIIGHGKTPGDLPPNVRILGARTHGEINAIAAEWRAAIIPFRIGPLADAVDPIKIYEYFALGLPVVSFRMPQIDDYPHTETVASAGAFVLALDRAIAAPVDRERLEAFLAANTWSHRLDQILGRGRDILRSPPVEKTFKTPGGRR